MNTMVLISYGIFLVLLYLLLIYPKNKQAKKIQAMRNALQVGDEIITIGGTVGRIVRVENDEITFQTGPDNVTIQLKKWAVGSLNEKKTEQIV